MNATVKRIPTALTLALTLSMLTALFPAVPAHASEVRYDYDGTVDFSRWETMAWRWPESPNGSSMAEARIRRALEAGFAAEGYTFAHPSEADFLIDFHAAAHRELRLEEGWGPRWRRDVRIDAYPTGVLIVDVFDRRTGRLAWRGAVSDALANDPEKAEKRTQKAVAELLEKFPPSNAR